MTKKQNKGFTLLEILLVIAAIGILAAIVLVSINPNRQINQIRATNVRSDLNTLYKALEQYNIDNGGIYPTSLGLTNDLKEICKTGSEEFGATTTDCTNKVDLRVLVPTYLAAVPGDTTNTYSIGINEDNNRLSLVVDGEILTSDFSINPIYPLLDQVFTTPGTYTYTVPEGVTKISAIVIGGGGGGASTDGMNSSQRGYDGGGGGGGGLRYGTSISVTPGETLDIIVGSGGSIYSSAVGPMTLNQQTGTYLCCWHGGGGGTSSIKRGSENLLFATGGGGGLAENAGDALGGIGTTFSATVSGGNGGIGRSGAYAWHSNWAGGGGGAGGYGGNGGNGAGNHWAFTSATDGSGGGGGGGARYGGPGGGVGLYGEGVSGLKGVSDGANGQGGSGGENGIHGTRGGNFGGGGGGASSNATWRNHSRGGNGAVRIMWRSTTGS